MADEADVLIGDVPEFASAGAIAQLIGVSTSTVHRLSENGILVTESIAPGKRRRYKTCASVQAYIKHVASSAAGSGGEDDMGALKAQKLKADIRWKTAQGELQELKSAIANGKYMQTEDAKKELTAFLIELKKGVSILPQRLAGTLTASLDVGTVRDLEAQMRKEVEDLLRRFVDALAVADEN